MMNMVMNSVGYADQYREEKKNTGLQRAHKGEHLGPITIFYRVPPHRFVRATSWTKEDHFSKAATRCQTTMFHERQQREREREREVVWYACIPQRAKGSPPCLQERASRPFGLMNSGHILKAVGIFTSSSRRLVCRLLNVATNERSVKYKLRSEQNSPTPSFGCTLLRDESYISSWVWPSKYFFQRVPIFVPAFFNPI